MYITAIIRIQLNYGTCLVCQLLWKAQSRVDPFKLPLCSAHTPRAHCIIYRSAFVVWGNKYCSAAWLYQGFRPVLIVNVFLVARPHAILEAACFGHYYHYLALRMLCSITKIMSPYHPVCGVSRKCSNCTGYAEGIMNNDNRPPAWLSELWCDQKPTVLRPRSFDKYLTWFSPKSHYCFTARTI